MASLSRSALREHIFKIVFSSEFRKGESPGDYIPLYFEGLTDADDERYTLKESDIRYISEKSEQIIAMTEDEDELIARFSKDWSFSRLGKAELALLRLAVFEMRFDEDIPVNVAVNEAVELSKSYCDEKSSGFINGILSSVIKENL